MADNKEALPVVAWAIYDSQGFYETRGCEEAAHMFCVIYNQRDVDPCKPYKYAPVTDHATATAALSELRAEVEQWKAFAKHCQRSVGAIKSKMTAEQVIEFLGEETSAMIDRMVAQDYSDIDPELLEFARKTLAARSAASGESAEGGV